MKAPGGHTGDHWHQARASVLTPEPESVLLPTSARLSAIRNTGIIGRNRAEAYGDLCTHPQALAQDRLTAQQEQGMWGQGLPEPSAGSFWSCGSFKSLASDLPWGNEAAHRRTPLPRHLPPLHPQLEGFVNAGGPHNSRLLIKSRYCDLGYNLRTSLCFTELNSHSALLGHEEKEA